MDKDRGNLEENLSPANFRCSAANGPNLLQQNAQARMREHECDDSPFGGSMASNNYGQWEKDYRARSEFRGHFVQPGGMTFKKGDVLKDEK